MPKDEERRLKAKVNKDPKMKKWSQERKDAYVYGTLRKQGWKPKGEK